MTATIARRLLLPLVLLLILAPCLLALPLAAQQVGVTSTTSGAPRGTPPAQTERILRVGIDILASERVTTGTADRAHLVFLDGSALTVGVNSDLVIDRFVYDPSSRTGDLAMTSTRGAFRFVGGAISKKSEVIFRTPTANIGVRGGIATITIGADGSTTATFLFGDTLTASNAQGTQKAIRFGSQIFVPAGGAPLQPVVLQQGSLQAYLGLFERTQTTGNIVGPGDRAVLDALVANLNSQRLPYVESPIGLSSWLTYLELLAVQAVTTTNASRPGSPAPAGTTTPSGGSRRNQFNNNSGN